MKTFIEKLENKVIKAYGFENKKTILIFKFTDILRKNFNVGYEV